MKAAKQNKVPKIEVMEVEETVTEMDTTVEMEAELTFPEGVLDIDAQDKENPQVFVVIYHLLILMSSS